ncbi:MAG TPA: efflux RND transporter periplasmic adaptor subunit [Desulfobacteraceae bacterium]|nr:efflux RND transporter periplasmic adaptor subunit [Desulfobacteraceae bacterium]
MKKNYKSRLIITALILASCAMLFACGKKKDGLPPLPEVAVVTVQPKQVEMTAELPGRTSAYLIAEVRPQVGGIIQKRMFREGSYVRAGQALFQIDPALYQAALAKAEANLTTLQLRVQRMEELLVDKAVSQQEYDDAAAALKQIKAEVQAASINLKYTTIAAPISGRIGKSNVTVGALVTAHQPAALATIQQMNPMYVDVTQSTADILRLRRQLQEGQIHQKSKNQQKARLFLDDGTEYPLKGTVQFRDVTVDPTTGSVILRIVFPNPKGVLLPGMFVRAVLPEGVNEEAIVIPQQAVSRNPKGEPFTLIVDEENKVQPRPLELGRAIGNSWVVSSGLAPGDRVIVEGMQRARPGTPVNAVPFEMAESKREKANDSKQPAKTK